MALEWRYQGVTIALQWRYDGDAIEQLQNFKFPIPNRHKTKRAGQTEIVPHNTFAMQWHYRNGDVWRHNGATMALQ